MVKHLSHSRAFPVAFDGALNRTLAAPLETILGRRYLAVAGIASTPLDDPSTGAWGASVGQGRTIRFTDGGTSHETLTTLDRPHAFGYHLDTFTGTLKPLVSSVEGRWAFEPAGTGTRITWSWDVTPTGVGRPAMPALGLLWKGTARQAFDDLETYLLE